jgi:hypothetical protein
MDPLLTNGIDPALLRGLDKRDNASDDARDPPSRRKRPAAPGKSAENDAEEVDEENKLEPDPDASEHKLDDLA